MRPIHQLCAVVVAGVLASFAGPAPALAAAPTAGGDGAHVTVDPAVHAELSTAGTSTFWVLLDETADLSGAAQIDDWAERGEYVMRQLRETAERSQPAVAERVAAAGGDVRPFWIANALLVTGGPAAVDAASTSHAVDEIVLESTLRLPNVQQGAASQSTQAAEWNLDMIGAPAAWQDFDSRGQGVTVGVIDTGVQYDHPALVDSYRGNTGDGSFDHHYNWWDPNYICGTTRDDPCDNVWHGTHVTGTIAGGVAADGNAIGVAPSARWIAAKGCENGDGCSEYALMSSLQWMLAPTDRYGQNPRPDLRPHVVSNSWGASDGSFTGFRQVVQALAAAGTLPVFSAGNNGPGCGTVGAPASYPEAYAVGSYDVDGVVAHDSSRGASPIDGATKPDISAPGVRVRSAIPNDGYTLASGTSMAAPHVSGTAALMWSRSPSLVGAVPTVRALLDSTAGDVDDSSCGGTAADNNTYGEGRLDAYAAVANTPPGAAGTVNGQVTDAADDSPVSGATVEIDLGDAAPTVTTGPDGRYEVLVSAGPATVSASAFGYGTVEHDAEVTDGGTTTVDLALSPVARHTVSGQIVDDSGDGVAGVEVGVAGIPVAPVLSGPDGSFAIEGVPEGSQEIAAARSACRTEATVEVNVDRDLSVTLEVSPLRDDRGYGCTHTTPEFLPANTVLPIAGDTAEYELDLPFPFRLYGTATETIRVSIDGWIGTGTAEVGGGLPEPIPSLSAPNASLYPYWADLYVDDQASVRTGVVGEAPDRSVVVEWRDVALRTGPEDAEHANRVTVQAVLAEDSTVTYQYAGLDSAAKRGAGNNWTPVLTGIEDERGQTAFTHSYASATLSDDRAISFTGPAAGLVFGTVVDGNDGEPVHERREAALTVTDAAGDEVTSISVPPSGEFTLALTPGEYTLAASATNYVTVEEQIEVAADAVLRGNEFALPTGRSEFDPSPLTFRVAPGDTTSLEYPVRNVGTEPINVRSYIDRSNFPDDEWPQSWLRLDGANPPSWNPVGFTVAAGEQGSHTIDVNAAGLEPGTYTGAFRVFDNGGRYYNFRTIPVTLQVDEKFGIEYHRAVDVGGEGLTGADGTEYEPDQRHSSATEWGYTSLLSWARTTNRPIAETDDDGLYQNCRRGLGEVAYRFDDLPNGAYTLDLHFVETLGVPPNTRVFDVIVNDEPVLAGLDVADLVGRNTALVRSVTLEVTDGQLDLQLQGSRRSHPVLCGLELTYRPQLSATTS